MCIKYDVEKVFYSVTYILIVYVLKLFLKMKFTENFSYKQKKVIVTLTCVQA